MTTISDIDLAAQVFQNIFCSLLDKHSPVKVFQVRKHYVPYISDETKILMAERDSLKKESIKQNDPILHEEFKLKRNEVKRAIEADKMLYCSRELGSDDSKTVWRTAYKLLGQVSSRLPLKISHQGEIINSPGRMANIFNDIFLSKVNKIREKAISSIKTVDPIVRLSFWLQYRQNPPSYFELKPINKQQLRKVIKRMKGGRSHGFDYIDSFSLKLAYPLRGYYSSLG